MPAHIFSSCQTISFCPLNIKVELNSFSNRQTPFGVNLQQCHEKECAKGRKEKIYILFTMIFGSWSLFVTNLQIMLAFSCWLVTVYNDLHAAQFKAHRNRQWFLICFQSVEKRFSYFLLLQNAAITDNSIRRFDKHV